MKRLAALLWAGLAFAAVPAFAAADDDATARRAFAAPSQLSDAERQNYRAIFAALRARDWAQVAGRLDEMRPGLLHDFARAQLYTMPGSPRVEAGPLAALLGRAPDLPQAPALARLHDFAQLRKIDAVVGVDEIDETRDAHACTRRVLREDGVEAVESESGQRGLSVENDHGRGRS